MQDSLCVRGNVVETGTREEKTVRILLLVLGIGLLQADTGEQFYRFPRGTTWTYRQAGATCAWNFVMTVVDDTQGRIVVESKEYRGENLAPQVKTMAWVVEDGCLLWGEFKDGKVGSSLRVYKLGSKQGDTWKSPVGGGKDELEAVHRGTDEVKVPAGTYRDTVQVALFMGPNQQKPLMRVDLAPKVGLVRFGRTDREQGLVELIEFKPGK